VTHNGESLPIAAWVERTGLSKGIIRARLERGWSADRTLTTPAQKRNARPEEVV
jgi:hypothetical protein